MTKPDDIRNLISYVENEGLDYAVGKWKTWDEIHDTRFHVLRRNYLQAGKELRDYIRYTYGNLSTYKHTDL